MVLALALLFSQVAHGAIWHVDSTIASPGDGSTWGTAMPHLQDALATAVGGDEIHVAAGAYYPDEVTMQIGEGEGEPGDTPNATFSLVDGVALLGGFPQGGGIRDPAANVTILSGDIQQDDPDPDGDGILDSAEAVGELNSYTVVTADGLGVETLLDGFFITAGGSGLGSGAGIYIDGGAPQIVDCHFSGHRAANGGAIAIVGGAAPSFSGCRITGCASEQYGGGVYLFNSDATFTDCVISDNRCELRGGGIYVRTNAFDGNPSLVLDRCDLTGNAAVLQGGGLHFADGTLRVIAGRFERNTSAVGGGAVYLDDCEATMIGCSISGNSGTYGGGIHAHDTSLDLANCSLQGNYATIRGGALRSYDFNNRPNTITLKNCLLWGNAAATSTTDPTASISHSNLPSSTISYQHCIVQNEDLSGVGTGNLDGTDPTNAPRFIRPINPFLAPLEGADLRPDAASPAIDTGAADPDAPALDLAGGDRVVGAAIDRGAYEFAGGPRVVAPVPVLRYLPDPGDQVGVADLATVFAPDAVGFGVVAVDPPSFFNATLQGTRLDLTDFAPDTAGIARVIVSATDGSATSLHRIDVELVPAQIFVNASAPTPGGGTSWATAFDKLQDALALAVRLPVPPPPIWVAGGTYFPDEGSLETDGERTSSFIIGDHRHVYGGFAGDETVESERDAVAHPTILSGDLDGDDNGGEPVGANAYHVVAVSGMSGVLLDGLEIHNGLADGDEHLQGDGAGLLLDPLAHVTLRGCRFANNRAASRGGAFSRVGVTPVVAYNCSFIGNHSGGDYGAGHFGDGSVTDCHFEANTAVGRGGGAGFNVATITRCTFLSNSAADSGGAAGGAVFTDCLFRDNTATGTGGGLSFGGILERCRFESNQARDGGGAAGSGGTITGCDFLGNTATQDGGALYQRGETVLTDSVFLGNYARSGGALYLDNSTATLLGCTLTGNRGFVWGGAVHLRDTQPASSRVDFINTIIWNNVVWNLLDSLDASVDYDRNADLLTFRHCLVAGISPSGASDLGGNLDGTDPENAPHFALPVNPFSSPQVLGDVRLLPDSAALEAGDTAAVPTSTDRDGNYRPFDADLDGTATVDLGPYEFRLPGDDADADGMPNTYELAHTDPPAETTLDPRADVDGDGIVALFEFAHDLDPYTRNAATDGLHFSFDDGSAFVLQYRTNPAAMPFLDFRIQQSNSLGMAPWETVEGASIETNGDWEIFRDPNHAGLQRNFFRLMLDPIAELGDAKLNK